MMEKRRFIVGLAISTVFLGISNVEAFTYTAGYASTGESTPSTPREDIEIGLGTSGDITYTCKYNYSVGSSKTITIDGYDINDNEIMKYSLNIGEDDRVLAGTSIGLNIYETKTVSWKVTKVEVTETKKKTTPIYKCTYKTATTSLPRPNPSRPFEPIPWAISMTSIAKAQTIANTCQKTEKYTTSSSTCPSAASYCELVSGPTFSYNRDDGTTAKTSTNETKIEECRQIAASAAISAANGSVYASYEIEMSDSNDINGTDAIKITNEDANSTRECEDNNCSFSYSAGMEEDSKTIKFYYRKARACINVKTAEVTYKTGNDQCDTAVEKEIPNTTIGSNIHWHYFIPLNAKSTDKIEVNMLKAYGGELTTAECLYVMQHNPVNASTPDSISTTYVDLIKPIANGEVFDGDYKCFDCNPDNPDEWNKDQSADYLEVQTNGCYLTSKIKIPVNQKFYNEVSNTDDNEKTTVRFNGFNFYYKPIDITDSTAPFPNGLPTTSLWQEWHNSQKKEPDLTKSFSKVTYIAGDIEASEVRNYNKNNSYLDWSNMNVDGTSKYIDNEGVIQRNNGINVYKLGCGPANENEKLANGDTNPLYQPGCNK